MVGEQSLCHKPAACWCLTLDDDGLGVSDCKWLMHGVYMRRSQRLDWRVTFLKCGKQQTLISVKIHQEKTLPVLSGSRKEGTQNPRKLKLTKSFLFYVGNFYSCWTTPRQRHISFLLTYKGSNSCATCGYWTKTSSAFLPTVRLCGAIDILKCRTST